MERHEVVSPLGLEAVERIGGAPRLDTLDGKTIGELWNGVFKGDHTFPIIRRLLQRRFRALKVVPFTEFPHAPGSDHPAKQRELAQRTAEMAKAKGCDAIISGNGA
ncbi:MAG: hypothetical protein IT531_07170 [Burkholderiales bacterium]|nr:hypothetical protein [Burkholderiales bacterium]